MKKTLAGALIVAASIFLLSAPNVLAQGEPCTADFNCDYNVDGYDVGVFIGQFGRSLYNDPCPDCYDSPCPCSTPCDPPAPVPKTGQTTSFEPGDDGYYQKGVAWPDPRWTDNGDGTVTDHLTGLIWLNDANCFGLRVFSSAVNDCNWLAEPACGLSDGSTPGDWRLPNRFELESLLDMNHYNPALPAGHPFADVQPYWYWSSTTSVNLTDYAWSVRMIDGDVIQGFKLGDYYVWPVRDPL